MKVLITGGTGFIGSNLCWHLLDKGYDITVLDNLSTGDINRLDESKIVIKTDLDVTKNIGVWVDGCFDVVIHLAAQIDVMASIEDPLNDAMNNVMGTLNVLNMSRKCKVKKFIFASSNAVSGDQEPPVHENMVPKPMSPYGASKLAGEAYCSAFYHSYGFDTVALRFSNVYGPGALNQEGVISLFAKQMIKDKSVCIFGDGKQTRDFIYVDDICKAIHLALETPNIGGQVFHVATETEISIYDLAVKMADIYGDKVDIIFKEARTGEIRENWSDISLARKTLGFKPDWELDDGLRITMDWFKENYKC